MSEHVDIDKHVRTYFLVFGALLFGTGITVAASYIDVSVPLAIVIGLFIASVKATLVACFFMHLIAEKKLIYWVLLLTVAFFIVLMAVPLLTSVIDQAGDFTASGAPAPH